MRTIRRRWRVGSLAGIALVATLLAWLAYRFRESAMAVVVDLDTVGLGVALFGLVLGATALVLTRADGGYRAVRLLSGAAILAALVALGLLAYSRFLSYHAESVSFRSGDIVLAGTLYQPRHAGPHPGVVLVHGSGPESREQYAFYARYLARRGIAALAYDKRGVGESGGELYHADYRDYAEDALSAGRLLAHRPDVDARAVGLVGFSEGGWVAPLAAARSDTVAFVAAVGTSGMTPAEQVATEMEMRLRARGHPDSIIGEALALGERVFAYQRTGEGAAELRPALHAARSEPWFQDAEDLPEEVYPAEDYAWWRSVMDFDPAPVWERVGVPVLLLKGGRDDRSPPGPMRERIGRALERGGNDDLTVRVFPDADHMLLEWPLGQGAPPPVFAEGYPAILAEWIKRQVGSPVG